MKKRMPQAISTLNLVKRHIQLKMRKKESAPGENHCHCPQLPDEVGHYEESGQEPSATPRYIHVLPEMAETVKLTQKQGIGKVAYKLAQVVFKPNK